MIFQEIYDMHGLGFMYLSAISIVLLHSSKVVYFGVRNCVF